MGMNIDMNQKHIEQVKLFCFQGMIKVYHKSKFIMQCIKDMRVQKEKGL